MIKWVDDGCLYGFYYVTEEGFKVGDGSEKMAKQMEREADQAIA